MNEFYFTVIKYTQMKNEHDSHIPCIWNEMKWNEKPIVSWRAKASSFEGQLNVYACDELFRMHDKYTYSANNSSPIGLQRVLPRSNKFWNQHYCKSLSNKKQCPSNLLMTTGQLFDWEVANLMKEVDIDNLDG